MSGVFIVKGPISEETLKGINEATNAWFAKAARGECGWICPDCCQSFPDGMQDECIHGHQGCTDCNKRDKLAAALNEAK